MFGNEVECKFVANRPGPVQPRVEISFKQAFPLVPRVCTQGLDGLIARIKSEVGSWHFRHICFAGHDCVDAGVEPCRGVPERGYHDGVTSPIIRGAQLWTRTDVFSQVDACRERPKTCRDTPNRLPKLNTRVRFP
jgi:hypothetical protein